MTSIFQSRHRLAGHSARLILLAVGLLPGCAHAAPPTTASGQPSTTPSTTPSMTPSSMRAATTQPIIRLADAVPLEALQLPGRQVDFASKFDPPQSRVPIYFGTVSPAGGEGDSVALIAVKLGDKLKAVKIEDDRLTSAQWMYAGAGPALSELWGVLDESNDPPAPDLVLVHSTDGGATWQVTALHKPTEQADFTEFQMDRTGHGRVTVYVSADVADPEARPAGRPRRPRERRPRREPIRTGYYHFRTTDDGKNWVLQMELDAMTPAGDVPEAEQPVGTSLVARKASLRDSR